VTDAPIGPAPAIATRARQLSPPAASPQSDRERLAKRASVVRDMVWQRKREILVDRHITARAPSTGGVAKKTTSRHRL